MTNGSSATGNCSNVVSSINEFTSICTDPTSSVLLDGVIPTLTGLDGDMWASQLLTLNSTGSTIEVAFAIVISQVERVELVMFNCPEWGISVQRISLRDNNRMVIGSGDLNSITSCDSLVRLCVPATAINPLVVTVQFDLDTDSNWVHLAEVTIYDDSTTCPPNTTITTEMNTATPTNTPPDPTTPTTTITTTQGITTATTQEMTTATTTTATTQEMTTGSILEMKSSEVTPNDATTPDNTTIMDDKAGESVIIPVVVVICVVFMIVGIMAAVLIQWRYHKHKTSHHTALGEGHSHAHTHSHPPPVKMCEETGQVCYSSPPEALGQLSPSHDTYSHLQRDTSEGRGGAQSEGEYSVVHMKECKEKEEYLVLFHANKPHVLERDKMEAMRTGDSTTHVYAQIDGVKKWKKETGSTGVTTHPAAYSSLDMSKSWEMAKPDTHLYDQVVKGKKGEVATHPHTPEADTAVDHFYAVLEDNREKKKGEVATHPHTPEADTAVDHSYAVLEDNREKKKGEVATHPHTPEADTTVDHFYAVLEDNRKKKKGEVATHPHTPEADTAVDHSYAVLEDNREKKKGEVATHPHTPEADTTVDHFYAVLEDNRKKKKGEVATHPHTPEADTAVDHSYAVLEDNREKKKGEVATHPHTLETDTAVDHFYAILEDEKEET